MMAFLTGPLLLLSLLVFTVGLIVRGALYVRGLDWRLDRVAYSQYKRGIPGALVSIFRWLTPAGTNGWRAQPLMTLAFFLFHVGAVLLPLFLLGHTVVLEDLTDISLPSLPMAVADALTVLSLAGLILLAARRCFVPVARSLTSWADWGILLLTAAPFLTGFVARMGFAGNYDFWMTLHIASGELFLIAAPFTKLSHIVLYFMSRAQIGMDFAIKRGGASRGAAFPW